MQLNLDDTKLKAILAEAILSNIDEVTRQSLIKGAVEHLLTPQRHSYGGTSPAPITEAFQEACRSVAREVAVEAVANDPAIRDKLKELLAEAAERVFVTNREQTIERMAQAITDGLRAGT